MKERRRAVVIVDDESDFLWVAGDVLEEEGFQVVAMDHPDLAEGLTGEVSPALFILDLVLPDMDGLELARSLKAEGFADVPMVGISASKDRVRDAEESGLFVRVLEKPIQLDDLVQCVRDCGQHAHWQGDRPDADMTNRAVEDR